MNQNQTITLQCGPSWQEWVSCLVKGQSSGNFGKIKRSDSRYVFDYQGGKLVVPPNGWCVLNSFLQLSKWDTELELFECIAWFRSYHQICSGIDVMPFALVRSMCSQLGLQLVRLGDVFDNSKSALIYETSGSMGHVGAYVPRKFLPTSRIYVNSILNMRLKASSNNIKIAAPKNKPQINYKQKMIANKKQSLKQICAKSMKTGIQDPKVYVEILTLDEVQLQHSSRLDVYKLGGDEKRYMYKHLKQMGCIDHGQLPKFSEHDKNIALWVQLFQSGYADPRLDLLPVVASKFSFKQLTGLVKKSLSGLYVQLCNNKKYRFDPKIDFLGSFKMEFPEINNTAKQVLSRELIAAIHSKPMVKLATKARVGEAKLVGGVEGGKMIIRANPSGRVDRNFLQVLNKYGHGLTQATLEQGSDRSGGHEDLRFDQDLAQASMLSRLLGDLEVGINVMWDVGSKFLSIQTLLLAMKSWFKNHPTVILHFIPIRPNDTDYNRVYYKESLTKYLDRSSQGLDNLVFHAPQVSTVQKFEQDNLEKLYVKILTKNIKHEQPAIIDKQPVTVADNLKYLDRLILDKNYYFMRQNIQGVKPQVDQAQKDDSGIFPAVYEENKADLGQVDSKGKKSLLSTLIPELGLSGRGNKNKTDVKTSIRTCIYMSDVHYYLPGWTPSVEAVMYVCGALFHLVPGQYDLPLGQGTYSVVPGENGGFAQVHMQTRGTSNVYSHPLVHVRDCTAIQHYGWYSRFQLIKISLPGSQSCFEGVVTAPFYTPGHSVQGNYFKKYYQNITPLGLQTVSTELQYWSEKAWNSNDLTNIEQCFKQKLTLAGKLFRPFQKYQDRVGRHYKQVSRWVELLGQKSWASLNISETIFKIPYIYEKVDLLQNVFHRNQQTDQVQILNNGVLICDNSRTGQVFNDLPIQNQQDVLMGGYTQDKIVERLSGVERKDFGQFHQKLSDMLKEKKDVAKEKKQSQDFSEAISYYYTKPIPLDLVKESKDLNPLLVPESLSGQQQWDDNCRMIKQWLSDQSGPVRNGKDGSLMKVENIGKVIPTGFQVISDGQRRVEFEWSSQSVQNQIHALYGRQFSSNVKMDDAVYKRFDRMTDKFYKDFDEFMKNYDWEELRKLDPYEWVDNKAEWSQGKKDKYRKTLFRQLSGRGNTFVGSFRTMVKSGEIYYDVYLNEQDGYLFDQASRPRNICVPCTNGCGLLTAIQSTIWNPVKLFCDSFIQGLSKAQMQKLFQAKVTPLMKSISLDGSAFDSSQYAQLQRASDHKFWQTIMPYVLLNLEQSERSIFRNVDVVRLCEDMLKDLLNVVNTMFVNINGIMSNPWSDEQIRIWNRDWAMEYGMYSQDVLRNWVCYQVEGTTFSGHPTLTTLGNTLRSILYVCFYFEELSIENPWRKNVQIKYCFWFCAAGDDVCIFVLSNFAEQMKNKILFLTSRQKYGQVGLGQIITEVHCREWWNIDFCSKWAFCKTGLVEDWHFYRDVEKTLSTKQYFTKQSKLVAAMPSVHASAMLQGFKAEHCSKLVEDFFIYRKWKWEQISGVCDVSLDLSKYNDRLKYTFTDCCNSYSDEELINERLQLSLYDLLILIGSDTLYLGGIETDITCVKICIIYSRQGRVQQIAYIVQLYNRNTYSCGQ